MEDRKPTVLIVARDADTANDVGNLVRACDCIAWFAGNDETIPQALVRLRPDVVMLDTARPATDLDRAAAMASAVNANIVLFGDEEPGLREIARARGLRSVALEAPARAFGYAIKGTA